MPPPPRALGPGEGGTNNNLAGILPQAADGGDKEHSLKNIRLVMKMFSQQIP